MKSIGVAKVQVFLYGEFLLNTNKQYLKRNSFSFGVVDVYLNPTIRKVEWGGGGGGGRRQNWSWLALVSQVAESI